MRPVWPRASGWSPPCCPCRGRRAAERGAAQACADTWHCARERRRDSLLACAPFLCSPDARRVVSLLKAARHTQTPRNAGTTHGLSLTVVLTHRRSLVLVCVQPGKEGGESASAQASTEETTLATSKPSSERTNQEARASRDAGLGTG